MRRRRHNNSSWFCGVVVVAARLVLAEQQPPVLQLEGPKQQQQQQQRKLLLKNKEPTLQELAQEVRTWVREWVQAVWRSAPSPEDDDDHHHHHHEKKEADAVEAYVKACERYGANPNGAMLSACRFGSRVVKPRGTVTDADLLAIVDAVCESTFARGLDLTAVEGGRFFSAGPALAHAISNAAGGRGLSFLAVSDAALGPTGAELVFNAAVGSPLRALKLSNCGIQDRGADALLRSLDGTRLERVDVSRNGISPRRVSRLRRRRSKVVVELRGNARALEATCLAIQGIGAVLAPIAGAFLVYEARRLELDPTAVASCAAYALALVLYFAASASRHLAELDDDDPKDAKDSISRILAYAAVGCAHAPFFAFVDLGLPPNFALRFFGATAFVAAVSASLSKPARLDPPSMRPSRPLDALALTLLGASVLGARFGPLKTALGGPGSRLLVASALAAFAAILFDLRNSPGGANKPLAYLSSLLASGLHYATVLTALVWHFLPPLEPSSSGAAGGAGGGDF